MPILAATGDGGPKYSLHGKNESMSIPFKPALLLPIAAMTVMLSACGGGGSDAVAPPVPPSPAVPTYSAIATNVTPPVYASAENAAVSSSISAIRQGTGAGLLRQNAALDLSAKNHAAFLVNNQLVADGAYLDGWHEGVLGGHYEDPAKVGYTGKTAQARATAAGYAGSATEIISFGAASAGACVAALENSVYHLTSIISPFVDMGIAFDAGTGSGSACVIVFGTASTTLGQLPAAGSVVASPYDGKENVAPIFYNVGETPNPAPDLARTGPPVAVSLYSLAAPAPAAGAIVIHAYAMTQASGAPVAARVLANAGVTSTGPALTVDKAIAGAGFVFLLPTAPLAPRTLYKVTFAATVQGTPVSKNWSFTTGDMN